MSATTRTATRTATKNSAKTATKAAPRSAGEAPVLVEDPGRDGLVARAVALARRVGPGVARRLGRPLVAGAVAAVLTGGGVLLATELAGEEYEGRVSLVAGPLAATGGAIPQYGEVVALTFPALVELARSPTVLRTAAAETGASAADLAEGVSVELVPASGLARLAVRGPSPGLARAAAGAIARAVIKADLLAPAAALRLLDEHPDVIRVAPDRPLGLGLALAGAAAAGVTVGALRHLRRTSDDAAVRVALEPRHPVVTLRADEDDLPERLALLCAVAGRPPRVVAVAADLTATARTLAERVARQATGEPPEASVEASAVEGSAVVAVTRAGQRRQDQLAAVAGVLPASSALVAVVLA